MKYIASLSFGKDSLAQIILIKRLGLPLDDVIYCDIRYTRELSGEMPEMARWIPTAEEILRREFGVQVRHLTAQHTFKDYFFRVKGDLEAQYGKRYEFIIYANKGRAKFNPDMPRYEDIWKFARVTGKEQIHQNQKPTDLLSRIINQHTRRGDLVLDPFAGSGSTAVAAYRLQRDYIGFEIDDEYYEAGNRWLAAVRSQLSIFDLL